MALGCIDAFPQSNSMFTVNTHVHADHITGTGKLKKALPECKSVLGDKSGAKADLFLGNGDFLKFGEQVMVFLKFGSIKGKVFCI